MSGAVEREGGCACGRVSYRLAAPPLFVNCCHCRSCQRQTGSAFVMNAIVEASAVSTLAGALAPPTRVPTDSGRPHDIYRCPDCATALWSDYGGRRRLFFVRVGTLDQPDALVPDAHIYVRSKLPWITLPDMVPRFDGYYDPAAVWPASSLARRRAILGG